MPWEKNVSTSLHNVYNAQVRLAPCFCSCADPDCRSGVWLHYRIMNPQISVIIPVYNAVRALDLVLAGYSQQSFRDFEVFIADDGSGPEVRAFVETSSRQASFPIRYVFQPDEGFRRSSILNRAVRACSARYLIFADADCIPHTKYVQAHWERRGSRAVLCGRRVNLTRQISEGLTPQDILSGRLEHLTPGRLMDALLGRGSHWDEGILIRNRTLHGWINYKEPTLLGSNFSLGKSLLEEINGFNEDFVGYGGEDTELEYRLRLAGARFFWVRHLAIQYHLYHPARAGSAANLNVLARTQARGEAACANGLRKD
jgi:glycosyltransferase involved in cell wall biosynthesis